MQPVSDFVQANCMSESWFHREAAILALGSIMEGPPPGCAEITNLLQGVFDFLLDKLNDKVPAVR